MATKWIQVIPSRSVYDSHGLRERRLSTGFYHIRIGFSADPLKDDNWARRHAVTYGGFDSPKWRREQGIDYKAFSGQRIWPHLCELHNQIVDVSTWTKFRIIDQGIRHPTVCLWVAVNQKGDRHVYREYYANDRSIAMNCRAILSMTPENEHIYGNYIDPSCRKRSQESLTPLITLYEQNGICCIPADNSFSGYDLVLSSILSTLARYAIRTGDLPKVFGDLVVSKDQFLTLADKPALTFDRRFTSRCFDECCNLRWQENKGDLTEKADPEKPMDKDDDGPDCVRYAIASGLYYKRLPQGLGTIDFRARYQEQLRQRELDEIRSKSARRAYHR